MTEIPKNKLAIRFGLGGIKAVGVNMMESVAQERRANGAFKDIYDFCARLDPRSINKKSIEALAKSGAFDVFCHDNRRQIHDSFEILSRYGAKQHDEKTNSQMSLFSPEFFGDEQKPELKKVVNWTKEEKLQKEFDAFGFFLKHHPLDDQMTGLKKRGVVFSEKITDDSLEDNYIIKMAGVVASSKHRSSARGRFAYLTMSDPLGIYEVLIFDEALITNHRDSLENGSVIVLECLVKKDDGGTRLLVREVTKLVDFLTNVAEKKYEYENITKQKSRPQNSGKNNPYLNKNKPDEDRQDHRQSQLIEELKNKKAYSLVEIIFKEREVALNIKSFLSQRVIGPEIKRNLAKTTKVNFCVMSGGKIHKISLEEDYLLDDFDLRKIRTIDKIIDAEGS